MFAVFVQTLKRYIRKNTRHSSILHLFQPFLLSTASTLSFHSIPSFLFWPSSKHQKIYYFRFFFLPFASDIFFLLKVE